MIVRPARFPHEQKFLDAFDRTAREAGVGENVCLQWGTHDLSLRDQTIYVECGWLPRYWYQVSHTGINAQHHLAPLDLPVIDADQAWKADVHLRRMREGKDAPPWGYLDIAAPPVANVPEKFILAPLQMESDTNCLSMPEALRTNQGFVNEVTAHVEAHEPGLPIVFKQHPNTQAGSQLGLVMWRKCDKVHPHRQGHVYQYLKHPGCVAVVTANSNVAHDALLWDVPVVAFGSGIWRADVFLVSLYQLPCWFLSAQKRQRYVYALTKAQWRLPDARDKDRVRAAVRLAEAV